MEQVVPWRELCAQAGVGRPTEEALYDSISMRQFVGIDLGCASGFRTRRQF
jgi:hypothetical protein